MPAVWRVVLLVVLCAGFSAGAASAQDADYDGIPDALEAELAARFVPTLRPPSPGGCYAGGPLAAPSPEWLPRLIYRARYPTKNGNSYPDVIAITFEVLYDWDCGPDALGIYPTGHRGDNEPFIVFLKYDYNRRDWVYSSLSATGHWHASMCFSKEARLVQTPPGESTTHPDLWIGHQKHSNHTSPFWPGCHPGPYDSDNDTISTIGFVDLPGPSRLFNVGEPYAPLISDLGQVRPEWQGEGIYNGDQFFDAGRIADALMSLDGNDWTIYTGPPAPSVLPWDSGWGSGYCDYQLPTNVTIGVDGGTDSLSLLTQGHKCGWRVDSQDDWITATVTDSSFAWPGNGFVGSGNGDVSYSMQPNPSTNPRVGTFTVGPVTVTVTQAGVNCTPNLSPSGESIGDQGANRSFHVQAPEVCDWTPIASDPWISIVSGSGPGNGWVTYSVTENNGPTVRSGDIDVGGAVFRITQAREVCRTTLTPTTRTMPAESGSDTLTVSATFANCQWTATSNQPWLGIVSGVNRFGSGTLRYTVAVNDGPNPRIGTIAIGEASATITQSACTIQVNFVPGTAAPGESTGQVTLEVQATRIGGTTLCREVRVPYTFVGADATPNLDYQNTPGEVVFAAGTSSPATEPVTVLIINDGVKEGDEPERFDIVLSTPVGATLAAPGRRTISITEDDLAPGTDALGDYDGDGMSDPAVFRPSTQTWDVRGKFVVQFGQPGDLPVPGDYNGDGSTDVAVYRPSTGEWLVRNQSTRQLGAPGDIPVPADYDGDGDTDVAVYRLSTRQWLVLDQPAVQFGDPGDVPVPGDYNGDRIWDIAVYRPSTGFWYGRNPSVAVQHGGPGEVPVAADYDGDGRTDIAVYRPTTGLWRVRNQFEVLYGNPGDIPVPRDYDRDGRADIAVYRLATSFWHIRYQIPVQHGQILDLPAPGAPLGPRAVAADYDGNRTTDIAVYRPLTGQWFVRNGVVVQHGGFDVVPVPADYNGDGLIDAAFYYPPTGRWSIHGQFEANLGQPGDIPVPGDYNGDGATDIAVYTPSTGTWLLNGQNVQLGTAGDWPVPGDYNGDGVTDMAVYTPSTGTWRIRNQPTVQYGDPGDVPVPADYNGDGVTDIAVFRAVGGRWYVRNQAALQIGDPGDIPAPGDYNGDGILDAAVFRPSTRIWYVRNQPPVEYGDPGDIPLSVIRQDP